VEIVTEGEPAEDHLVTTTEVNPDMALVQGPEENLGNIKKVMTLPVNVGGADETFTVTTSLAALPAGTAYVGSGEVVVQVFVEGLFEKTVTLRKSDIEIRWGLPDSRKSYEIQNDTVEVRVKGRQSVLDNVNAGSLSPYIDVSQQPDGIISLPLRFDRLSGIEQTNFPLVEVLIQSKRSINLQTDQIYIENRSGGLYNYSFNNAEVVLELKGDSTVLDQVVEQNLNPSVNVDGLGAGIHTVEISVKLPEGVEIATPFTAVMSITNKD
jgi:YbbR domain-containing protein